MPGMLRVAVSAGTALLFEGRCWHTSLLNTSGIDRLAAVYTFAPFWCAPCALAACCLCCPLLMAHGWCFRHKQSPTLAAEAAALDASGEALTALERQLLGLEELPG